MAVGRQFENTYWHGSDGQIRQSIDSRSVDASSKLEKPLFPQGEAPVHSKDTGKAIPTQGMLFDPYTATGHKNDPLVHDRQEAIGHALHLQDVDMYRKRLGDMIPSQNNYRGSSKRGEKGVRDDIDLITRTLDNSDMPTHVIKKVNAPTVLDPNENQKAYAEDYSNRIKLNTTLNRRAVEVPGTSETRPVYDKGAPVMNKNWETVQKKLRYSEAPDYTHHGITQQEGVHFRRPNGDSTAPRYPEGNADGGEYVGEGDFTANVYPGKGKSNDKHVATDFQAVTGLSGIGRDGYSTGDGYKREWFHTRHEAVPTGETETIETPSTIKYENERTTRSSTLTHEIGHTLDPRTTSNYTARRALGHRADPAEEGLADGFADRYSRHAGQFERTLAPGADRAKEMGVTGYSTDHHLWAKNQTSRALYAAVRTHVALGDDNHKDVPNRHTLSKQFRGVGEVDTSYNWNKDQERDQRRNNGEVMNKVNTLMLGQMYHEHPHVRQSLEHLGMTSTGETARDTYLSSARKGQSKKGPEPEQMSLPMEIPDETEIDNLFKPRGKK